MSRNSRCSPSGERLATRTRVAPMPSILASRMASGAMSCRIVDAHQRAAFRKVAGPAANDAAVAPASSTPISQGRRSCRRRSAGLALAQEDGHPHLELFGKRDDAVVRAAPRICRAHWRPLPHRRSRKHLPIRRRQTAASRVALRATVVVALFCCCTAVATAPNSGRMTLITSVICCTASKQAAASLAAHRFSGRCLPSPFASPAKAS